MEQICIGSIKAASKLLSEDLLNNMGALTKSGPNIDREVKKILFEVGNSILTLVYKAISQKLIADYKQQGWHIEQHASVNFKTLYGEVKAPSPYLRKAGESKGMRPMKAVMGVVGNGCSEGVERALVDFGSEKSFRRAVGQFQEHYGWELGVSCLLRRTESAGEDGLEYLQSCLSGKHIPITQPDPALDATTSPCVLEANAQLSSSAETPATIVTTAATETSEAEAKPKAMLTELDGCSIRTGEFKKVPLEKVVDGKTEKLTREVAFRDVRTGFVRPMDGKERTYISQLGSYPEICANLKKGSNLAWSG